MNRRNFVKSLAAVGATALVPALVTEAAAQATPDAQTITRQLKRAPSRTIAPKARVTIDQIKRNHHLRSQAPSIDIQSINFAFGSSAIDQSQYWKVQQIAIAINQMLGNGHRELFLIEGHTDAVGSRYANQALSEARAASLAGVLAQRFGVPYRALNTIGYGEDYLLVPTPAAEWRNRRVTLRRVTDFVSAY
ncbi:OmpA family protein [Oricola sp.]|uniref:OmpA family protein n=1 Tax=Oricola sp. TaxID=1979950 RepID=UPI0025E79B3D|nr:OmpA family protein [Oricola sp.]MCI5073826.1 OmpA family protein [Oricola sp.]